jgi:type III restriction enzyme
MELKPYQQKVINDLAGFISYIDKYQKLDVAYKEYWNTKGVFIKDSNHLNGLQPYKSVISGVPHVAMKVPTAGGKTFIAANALRTIFDSLPIQKDKVVVWLVPSITILDQTIKSLSDPSHPYRQKIDTHFNGRVEIYQKEDLLQGASFNSTTVKEQLSIFVLSFDSFRSSNKEGRKVYQENENLTNFFDGTESEILLSGSNEGSLMNVIRKLNPVIVVDESHNAESDLSVEMLNNLNPSFVLDLTATPRANSNIISFVDSLELKKENMVKLPVLVYNHHDVNEVIASSVELRNNLELSAKSEVQKNKEYIRPIVLFQAEPRNASDSETFEKIKERLVEKGIPENEIAIKTANINEIKNKKLMSKDCSIRYIITVNALKEGWDAPFAYILASLANRSSKVDVEQILGRILRQPYTKKHSDALLNMSYVFTASQNFHDTLESIVAGLNKSGFSKKDFRVIQAQHTESEKETSRKQLSLDAEAEIEPTKVEEIDETQKINVGKPLDKMSKTVDQILDLARVEEKKLEKTLEKAETDITWGYTDELYKATNIQDVKDRFKGEYQNIKLPQFHMKSLENSLFNQSGGEDVLLSTGMVLDDQFELRKQNSEIDFDSISLDVYQVDVEESGQKDDYTPKYKKLGLKQSQMFIEYINALPEESQIRTLADLIVNNMGKMEKFADSDMKAYVIRVIEGMSTAMMLEMKGNPYTYSRKIKQHIEKLAQERSQETFCKWIDSGIIYLKDSYSLPNHIAPTNSVDTITKSLYVAEQSMNGLETEFISDVASIENISFWHKIIERKGFNINGFINHYPDFLIVTDAGKKIIVETKGDHLDNTDSQRKLKLGQIWANKAGSEYRYFMAFNDNPIQGAYTIKDLVKVINEL